MHNHHGAHDHAPIHQGVHTAQNGMKKILQRASVGLGLVLPMASCTNTPYYQPAPHRAIGMSPTTLGTAIQQARRQNNPQMAIEALVDYARHCKTPLTSEWLTYARTQLNRARAFGGKLSPEQTKLMILWLYWNEKVLPPIDFNIDNNGTAQIEEATDQLPA